MRCGSRSRERTHTCLIYFLSRTTLSQTTLSPSPLTLCGSGVSSTKTSWAPLLMFSCAGLSTNSLTWLLCSFTQKLSHSCSRQSNWKCELLDYSQKCDISAVLEWAAELLHSDVSLASTESILADI